MNVTVNIQAPELTQAINNLAAALQGKEIAAVEHQPKSKPSEKQVQHEPVKAETLNEQTEKTTEETSELKNVPSVVEIRAKAQEIGKTPEGKQAIKELLNEFGAKSISSIPEDKRAEFMERLELL